MERTSAARGRGIGKSFGVVFALEGHDAEGEGKQVHELAGSNGLDKATLRGALPDRAVAHGGRPGGPAEAGRVDSRRPRQRREPRGRAPLPSVADRATSRLGHGFSAQTTYQLDVTADGRYVAGGYGPKEVNGYRQVRTPSGDAPHPLRQLDGNVDLLASSAKE